jgi:hypothetical protein
VGWGGRQTAAAGGSGGKAGASGAGKGGSVAGKGGTTAAASSGGAGGSTGSVERGRYRWSTWPRVATVTRRAPCRLAHDLEDALGPWTASWTPTRTTEQVDDSGLAAVHDWITGFAP